MQLNRNGAVDCQSTIGSRCLQAQPSASGAATPFCTDMSCSDSGQVLVDGAPCDSCTPPHDHIAPVFLSDSPAHLRDNHATAHRRVSDESLAESSTCVDARMLFCGRSRRLQQHACPVQSHALLQFWSCRCDSENGCAVMQTHACTCGVPAQGDAMHGGAAAHVSAAHVHVAATYWCHALTLGSKPWQPDAGCRHFSVTAKALLHQAPSHTQAADTSTATRTSSHILRPSKFHVTRTSDECMIE